MTESRFIPNSYQTPNAYADDLMAFLTSEEWKVLSYAVRRIFGFQKRQDRISKSQFMNGIKNGEGEQLDYGTGLGERALTTALDALAKFGILLVIDDNDKRENKGKLYGLQLDERLIDIQGLRNRLEAQHEREKHRMQRARVSRKSDGFHKLDTPPNPSDPPLADKATPPLAIKDTPPLADKAHNNQGNPVENQGGRDAPSRAKGKSDPRSNHPAIQLVKGVTGRMPPKPIYDYLIKELGDHPDGVKFARVFEAWCLRGFKITNYEGQIDWYKNGIPQKNGKLVQPTAPVDATEQREREAAETRARIAAARAKQAQERQHANA